MQSGDVFEDLMEKVSAFNEGRSEHFESFNAAKVPEPTSATKTKPQKKINRLSLNVPKNYESKTNMMNMSTPRA